MPTSQTTVTGAASKPSSHTDGVCPPGMAMVVMVMPTSTVMTPTPTSMASLLSQLRSRMSSTAIAMVTAPVTARICHW